MKTLRQRSYSGTSGIVAPVPVIFVYFSLVILLCSNVDAFSQKRCTNPPTISLSSSAGSTCYLTPITVSNNIFGGSSTSVSITHNGHGSVAPFTTTASPFSFTYTPDNSDAGKIVTITVTTDNPNGSPCKAATARYELTVTSSVSPPVIGGITQPTCTSSTGSVALTGLPSYAGWTVVVSPGGLTIEGTGTGTTVEDLSSGTYTFTVSVSDQCVSLPSAEAVIQPQPSIPDPPQIGAITAPNCTLSTGSVVLYDLPSPGQWTLTRYPGTVITTGSGTITTVTGIPSGTYNFIVTNSAGCSSIFSSGAFIPDPPEAPSRPLISNIVQPTYSIPTGSVTLTGLPSSGTWTIIRLPDNITYGGSGSTSTITELQNGDYTFRVRNQLGCISPESDTVSIYNSSPPDLVITDPEPICNPAICDLTSPAITIGSDPGLTYTYWTDEAATVPLVNPAEAPAGVYYIKGINRAGYFSIGQVTVTAADPPQADPGPDQTLSFVFSTNLEAILGTGESGYWQADKSGIVISDTTDPHAVVSNLSGGTNTLYWIVSNNVCPADTGKLVINVGELLISTLITPNGDASNEYFIVSGLENLGKTELTIFDRRGVRVFQDSNYKNNWNGVDYNQNPLMNDTYFYLLKSSRGKSLSGYVVIKR